MRNIKLILEYDGTGYCGWQSQPHGNTVQQKLEAALAIILKGKVSVNASGRTDAGVHAVGQVVNFQTASDRSCRALLRGGNTFLPNTIRILSVRDVGSSFNARYSSRGKQYRYTIRTEPSVFNLTNSWYVKKPLDISRMKDAAVHLLGQHDFRSFCVTKTIRPHYRCVLSQVAITSRGSIITITVNGNRFLHNMVRVIAGTLVDVGLGKIDPADIPRILATRNRDEAGITAPAYGLCLLKVKYR